MVDTIKCFGQMTEDVTDLVRSILSVRVKCVLQVFTFIKSNCSTARILFDSKCWPNLLNITISRTFDKAISNDTGLYVFISVLSPFVW